MQYISGLKTFSKQAIVGFTHCRRLDNQISEIRVE